MAYRCLMVESGAQLALRSGSLVIETDEEHLIPLEDISVLLIESRRSSVSLAVLSAAAQQGIAVMVCDERHLPCGVLMPFAQHSRHLQVVKKQMGLSAPAKNRLWQQVVQAKIANQAACLRYCHKPVPGKRLEEMALHVQSGDRMRSESTAAARYFPALFGGGFTRGEENGINAALNYGYALLRACVARTLSVYGLLLCLGIQHHSELNPMNLADDLMEPFRPVVDLYVASHISADEIVTPQTKRALFSLLSCDVLSLGQRHSVLNAIERMVQSYVSAMDTPHFGKLSTPGLIPIRQHRYE